ncbi:hypothetical protein [Halalkalibacter urbisdiaboli]|uniref:hypothetical protein n=1 Tax=Halalkalibacter urbisdiaboli TaxID=1960589 RepID=UPI000B44165D|nr:hypothetical protein [Halalkalibacter urbisdiaboli]
MNKDENQRRNMNNPFLLKQKLIHVQSELTRCKEQLKEYQEDYHYRQLDELKEKNIELQTELERLNEALEGKEMNNQQLTEELEQVKQELEQVKHELNGTVNENVKMKEQLNQERESSIKSQENVDNYIAQNKELSQLVSELKEIIENKDNELNSLRQEAVKLKESLKEKEVEQEQNDTSQPESWFFQNLLEKNAMNPPKRSNRTTLDKRTNVDKE